MKLLKRFISGLAAISVLLGYNTMDFTAIAEEVGFGSDANISQSDNTVNDNVDIGDDFSLEIDIPQKWSQNLDNWEITTDSGVVLYYKTSSELISDEAWGTYTDGDARPWNNGASFEEGEGYIKFWAVKTTGGNEETVTADAVYFMYDKTVPNAFGLEKAEISDNKFVIKNTYPISDNLSGIKDAFYIIDPENLQTAEYIYEHGTKIDLVGTVKNVSFQIPCVEEMNSKTVTVYMIDAAGNIQYSSIDIDTYKDLSAPELTVNGINSEQWVNNLNGWDIHSDSVNAKVYFKTADSDLEDWGSHYDSDAQLWTNNVSVPEGDRFIHFWAAYDDADRECDEETFQYKFDATPPENFSIQYEHESGYWEPVNGFHQPLFVIYGSEIFDKTSGINCDRIYYKVNQYGIEWEQGTVERSNQTVNEDGTISFTLDLSSNEWINNTNVTFYIVDNAGNKTSCILNEEAVSYDPSVPVINSLCVASSTDENAAALKYLSFGNEKLGNLCNSVYANGDNYLKVTITDNDLREIKVLIDDEITVIFTGDGKDNTKKWECLDGDNGGEIKEYFLKLSDLDMSVNEEHSLSIAAKDSQNASNSITLNTSDEDTEVEYTIIYDPFDDSDCSIDCTSQNEKIINDKNYYGKDFKDDINISFFDDNGIKNYLVEITGPEGFSKNTGSVDVSEGEEVDEICKEEVVVTDDNGDAILNEDGSVKTKIVTESVSYRMPYKTIVYTESINNTVYKYDGKYVITVTVEDLAGNIRKESYEFYVDSASPSIVEEKYTYNHSILNYLSFGIFGNETIDITITVEDNETGCGVDNAGVCLYWGDSSFNGKMIENNGVKEYKFEDLPVGGDDVPYITVTDMLDNSANYYFTTEDGKLANKNNITKTNLTLENIKPIAYIKLPKEKQFSIGGEIWYPSAFNYTVIAKDENAGLNSVYVIESTINEDGSFETKSDVIERGVIMDGEYTDFADMTDSFTKEAKYQYRIEDEGDYRIAVDAQDNAGNKLSHPNNSNVITQTVHIDKTDPEITRFMFSDKNDEGVDVERGTYGFYFIDDTKVRVCVKDDGNSSGINYVTLYCRDVNGQEKSVKVYSSDEDYHDENGEEYAEFTIEKGFKGQIWALAADNVASENPFEDGFAHTSGLRYTDGSIVEDAELHQSVSGITISEDIQTSRNDSDGLPLYNTSLPLTIDVQDTFSGISTIEWSVANDGSSGIITVANDGSYQSSSELASVIEDTVSTDANLITNLSFTITVSSNTNGNEVYVKLTDRSGNESKATKQYSIDTTIPTITATLSNQNPSNQIYYNTDQTVTVSITERNFNASDVRFILNGNEQIIGNWTSNGEGDDTVYTGVYTISSDGDYSYSITFTDMAGNTADSISQSLFVIDKTSPILKTNFDEFTTSEEKHYFGVDSINKTARITIIEHNFNADGANVEILKKEPGLEHNTGSMGLTSAYGWVDNGDEHTLEITFSENDDGIYLIRVSPVDLATNSTMAQETAVFEIDFTNPIISERNGVYVRDEEESYENLEIYNEKTGIEEDFIPSVSFSDTNFDHIEYDLTVYTPEYSNEKEIGTINPENDNGSISEKLYSFPEFEKDGVYSVDLIAVDKAGNRSVLCRNTSVLMMNTDVLAYISNSSKKDSTGWYSLQKDENTPISKRPDSFSDLDITVFAEEDSKTSIILRDENGESKDTGLNAENDEDMYGIGIYNYTLSKDFFAENYPEGTNKDLYLWVENTLNNETSHITLGWIRIDAIAPTCSIPDDLKNWKAYINSSKTITLSSISEDLDESQCVVFDNGKTVSPDNFVYSNESDTLSYTLDKGWHDISFVLVDEAGNAYTVQEISSIQVGLLYCLWFWILCGLIVIAGIILTVNIIRKKKL